MPNVCIKVAKYLLKMTERRIEHQVIQYVLLLVILLIFVPFRYRVIIVGVIFIVYFKTIKLLSNIFTLISTYRNRNHEGAYTLARAVTYGQMEVIENFCDLPVKPSIIICNYPAELPEYAVQWLIPRNLCIVVIDELRDFMERMGKDHLCVAKKNSFQPLKLAIQDKIKTQHVFAYINKPQSRLHKYDLGRVRTGIFYIAYELCIPVTPVAVDCMDHIGGALRNQKFQIHVGSTEIISNPVDYISKTKKFFRSSMKRFKSTKYT